MDRNKKTRVCNYRITQALTTEILNKIKELNDDKDGKIRFTLKRDVNAVIKPNKVFFNLEDDIK